MAKIQVKTKINGEETEFLCQPYDTVLDVLRRDLNMTGTKEVCSTGDCGACSITRWKTGMFLFSISSRNRR